MDFISPLIEPIVSLVLNPLKRHIGYLVKTRTNVQNMTNELEKLRACRDDIQKEIEDAERRQKQSTEEVKLWLERVRTAEDQVVTTKNEYENRGFCIFGDSSLDCWLAYKYGKRATKLLEEMVQLETQRKAFNAISKVKPPGHGRPMLIESTLLGLDRYVEEVQNYLNHETVRVIGIWGMGGVGKTTLMGKVNNSILLERDNLGFEHLIRVVVSREFQLKKLQAQVAKCLGLQLKDDDDAKERALIIFQYLEDKSFLLLLDDIWEWVNLLDVGIPNTHSTSSNSQKKRKQKVLLTTRSTAVCDKMGADVTIKVECLKKDDAKALFMKILGERNLQSNPGIHGLIEEVVGECAGLPLALRVIARTMAAKKTIPEWEEAIRALKTSQLNKIMDSDNLNMLPTLKFSYDSLKSEDLRRCFLYCSLWPEDFDIQELNLKAFCIETNLINDFDSMGEAYNRGHCLIEELKKACLLEDGSKYFHVKMHDVIRDLALWIASDCPENQIKWLVKSGIGLREALVEVEARKLKEAEVVSLMFNDIKELPCVPFECPKLSFLLLCGNPLQKIHPSVFQNMCALTYLDLSNTKINELPESITMLKRLRCLNLEGTYNLTYIPSGMISSLQELQVINIFYSKICEYLEDCAGDGRKDNGMSRRENIPSGMIPSFQELQVLNISDSICRFLEEACDNRMSRREKCLLEELECLAKRGLKGLSIDVRYSDDAFQRLSMLPHTVSIWRLRLEDLKGVVTLQLQHNIWRSLQRLVLIYCQGVEVVEFVVDAERKSETSSSPIELLHIGRCSQLKEILWRGVAPSAGFFHNLREVLIESCDGLKRISWVLELPSLVSLTLFCCDGVECLIDEAEEKDRTAMTFPTLKKLSLYNLPNLRHICGPQYGLPALQQLLVSYCPKLKKFPFPSKNNGISSKLKSIVCDKQWWEGLEWDDEGIKASMESIRIPKMRNAREINERQQCAAH